MDEILRESSALFDVRSPLEYQKGHIPGAINLPLFSDSERALVGTCYKKVGKREAIELGIELVSPKLTSFLTEVKKQVNPGGALRLYCWRGGMRSGFVSWFLQFVGFRVKTVQGGYKAFRRFTREQFEKPFQLELIGGFTGSGKTELLQQLSQAIDLEALACHKGSSFGSEEEPCPSQEHFENKLAMALFSLNQEETIFVEDESRKVGFCTIPDPFFNRMKGAMLHFIQVPYEERVERIVASYSTKPESFLIESTEKLQKRLGGERCQQVIQLIRQRQFHEAVKILLQYYDKSYTHALETKHQGTVHYASTAEILANGSHAVARLS
jgi:tRNA 2-selenouridine synthase